MVVLDLWWWWLSCSVVGWWGRWGGVYPKKKGDGGNGMKEVRLYEKR